MLCGVADHAGGGLEPPDDQDQGEIDSLVQGQVRVAFVESRHGQRRRLGAEACKMFPQDPAWSLERLDHRGLAGAGDRLRPGVE